MHCLMKRILSAISVLGLLLCTLPLNAQKGTEQRRGLWGEAALELGSVLRTKSYDGWYKAKYMGMGSWSATIGAHIPKLNGLQVGLGASVYGIGYPEILTFNFHLDLRYKPFRSLHSLQGFQIATRFHLPVVPSDGFEESRLKLPKVIGSLSLGWEFPRLLGPVGLNPAIGISLVPFSYEYSTGPEANPIVKKASSTQSAVFLRLGIIFN